MKRQSVPSGFIQWLPRLIAICFVIAALGHFRAFLMHGWLPYRFAPLPINAFWTALAFLDLLAAFCLLWYPRIGVVLALLIIASDVVVVFYATRLLGDGSWFLALQRELQWLFFGFILCSVPFIWRCAALPPAKT
jgi:hypothetical protein